MKLRSLFFGTLCMLMLGVSFTSCSDDDDDSKKNDEGSNCLLYTSPSPRDGLLSRMPSSA